MRGDEKRNPAMRLLGIAQAVITYDEWKLRGAKRRRLAPFQRMAREFDQMTTTSAAVARAFDQLAASLRSYERGKDWEEYR